MTTDTAFGGECWLATDDVGWNDLLRSATLAARATGRWQLAHRHRHHQNCADNGQMRCVVIEPPVGWTGPC